MQSDVLLALVAEVPSMAPKRAIELIQRALDMTRAMPVSVAHPAKCGELTRAALLYERLGAKLDSRALFNEALKAAEQVAAENSSAGYRQVSEALAHAPQESTHWMLTRIAAPLESQEQSTDLAYAYRDLARVALALGNRPMAMQLMERSVSTAQAMPPNLAQRFVIEDLRGVATQAGFALKLPEPAWDAQPMHDRQLEDALRREDLDAAVVLAEHPTEPTPDTQVNAWRQIAELQVKKKKKKEAMKSYVRAAKVLSERHDAKHAWNVVKAAVALGVSMRQNGLEAEGRQVMLQAIAWMKLMPSRKLDDHVMAATLIAENLWHYGMVAEVKQLMVGSYRIAGEYGETQELDQARLLSRMGLTLSRFAPQPSESKANPAPPTSPTPPVHRARRAHKKHR